MFSVKLENDDIQDFDLTWEQALLLTSDPPSDKVSEGLHVSMLQDSPQVHTIVALYNQEILRRRRNTRLSQTKNVCENVTSLNKLREVKISEFQSEDYRACGRN